MPKVAFITLGCKVNQYETNAMSQEFIEQGYQVVEHHEKADIYVVNTCTVTNMSDRKSRQMLRRVKELNSDAIVVACGCYVQVAKEELTKIGDVDLILGNNEKKNIVEYVERYQKEHKKQLEIQDLMQQKEFVEFGDVTYTEKTRAVIKIQDGCDRFCSYCVIPYARGRVRSRKPEGIISEITKIAKEGIKEVVITGIHVASYGKDFKNNYKLIDLLEEINKIDGIERIRLSSIEPLLITEEFIGRLTKLEKICHNFHLSLQSGCDETLKRMNRRYNTAQFRNVVKLIRDNYQDAILTADVIVGFPEETEEEFQKTYDYLKEIKFYKTHVFKYSPRKGTKAAEMKNQIDGNVKEQRSKKLIELSNQFEKQYNQSYVGKEVEILWEEKKKNVYKGHTMNYLLAHYEINDVKNDKHLENTITNAKCVWAENDHIIVEV